MFRVCIGLGLVAWVALTATNALAWEAKTVRIEPRPFYGATITLEAGVRVFRPMPPTTHMIVNPNRTPLNLSIEEQTRTINKTVHHHGRTGSNGHSYSAHAVSGGSAPVEYRYNRQRRGGSLHANRRDRRIGGRRLTRKMGGHRRGNRGGRRGGGHKKH